METLITRLRMRQLGLLIAIDEQRSLHRAADRLAMTQPAATKALREVEAVLGMPLFARTSRGLEPNDAGRCAIRYARLVRADLARMSGELSGIQRGAGGRLAVGTIMGAVPAVLARAVARVRADQPRLSIEIVEDTSARLLALLDQGALDLAIARSSVSPRAEAYDSESLHDEPVTVVAGTGHRLATAAQVSLADLADDGWIAYPDGMPLRRLLEGEFREAGLRLPPHLVETSSSFAIVSLLQQDPGAVSLLPTSVAAFFASRGMACLLPVALRLRTERYGIVTRRGVEPTPAAALFARVLREQSLGVGR